ncbi:hypothetical protein ACK2M2_15680 [Acinetobacter sp. TY1]|jgi:hypothetical protein|uniref:hypothetical protein n=1 Tax=Acinetobacter sp. TY1 TaxID=3387626 RepID=UPI003AF8F465
MASYSKDCIQTAKAWINEIDDIDSFLEELIEVNEKCTSSPSLEEFCASFSLNTTENLIGSPIEMLLPTIDVPIEPSSTMSIPNDISKILISLSIERNKEFVNYDLSSPLPYDSVEMIRNFKTQEVSNQYQCAA